jgi:chromosome segregation ATPase
MPSRDSAGDHFVRERERVAEAAVSGEDRLDGPQRQAERVAELAALAATSERRLAAERQARRNLAAELAAEQERRAELESQLGEVRRARHARGQKLARERSVRDETSAELEAVKVRTATLEERLRVLSAELKETEGQLERCRRRGIGRLRRGRSR